MDGKTITQDRLKALVSYNLETGVFRWNMARRRCRPGDATGCRMRNGYIAIRLDDVLYTAHRLAWLYVNGQWPAHQLDHINGNRGDNRISNLREATNAQNAQNRKRKDNKSGFPGVRKENHKWLAEIKVNYKPIRLGLFATPEDAHKAYLKAKHDLHPFSQH
jgi:hypothetical protein